MTTDAGSLVALCRAGFEAECAEDLAALAGSSQPRGAAAAMLRPGLVVLPLAQTLAPARLTQALKSHPPIFAREVALGTGLLPLPERDRITPIVAAAQALSVRCGDVWLEYPDTNDGKHLSAMCRRLAPLLRASLAAARVIPAGDGPGGPSALPTLHVIFAAKDAACVATSARAWTPAWPMGIPRLKMPRDAPSRSTQKLAEAFATFLSPDEQLRLLRPGLRAADLGAAPGGWTWQLAQRGLRVTAVDNGALKGSVASDPLVTHLREDGLAWRPRKPVDWLVCDIVLQPIRIADLVARWIADGDARRAIFNLKLPMRKRYDEVMRCSARTLEITARAGVDVDLRIRQLYHDREEVTAYLARRA